MDKTTQVAQVKWEVDRVRGLVPPGIVSFDRRCVSFSYPFFFWGGGGKLPACLPLGMARLLDAAHWIQLPAFVWGWFQ